MKETTKMDKILIFVVAMIVYGVVVAPVLRWNCNRLNMDWSPFVNGCVVREVKANG